MWCLSKHSRSAPSLSLTRLLCISGTENCSSMGLTRAYGVEMGKCTYEWQQYAGSPEVASASNVASDPHMADPLHAPMSLSDPSQLLTASGDRGQVITFKPGSAPWTAMFNGNIPVSWFLQPELEHISKNPDQASVLSMGPILRRYPSKSWNAYPEGFSHIPGRSSDPRQRARLSRARFSSIMADSHPDISCVFRRTRQQQHGQQQQQMSGASNSLRHWRLRPRPRPVSPFRQPSSLQASGPQQQQCSRCMAAYRTTPGREEQKWEANGQSGSGKAEHDHCGRSEHQLQHDCLHMLREEASALGCQQGGHGEGQQASEGQRLNLQRPAKQQQQQLWGPRAPGGGGPEAHLYLNPHRKNVPLNPKADHLGPDATGPVPSAAEERQYPYSKLESEGVQLLQLGGASWAGALREQHRPEEIERDNSSTGGSRTEGNESSDHGRGTRSCGTVTWQAAADQNSSGSDSKTTAQQSSSSSSPPSEPEEPVLGGMVFVVNTGHVSGFDMWARMADGSRRGIDQGISNGSGGMLRPRLCSCCKEKLHGRRPRSSFSVKGKGARLAGGDAAAEVGNEGKLGNAVANWLANGVYTPWWAGQQSKDGPDGSDWEESDDAGVEDFEEESVEGSAQRVGCGVAETGRLQAELGVHSDGRGVVYGFWSKCWLG